MSGSQREDEKTVEVAGSPGGEGRGGSLPDVSLFHMWKAREEACVPSVYRSV